VSIEIRNAALGDAEAVGAIHDEAVLAGNATLRTKPRPIAEVEAQLERTRPFLVALIDGDIVGWAGAAAYEEGNPYYDGVGEVAVYVAGAARGHGVGRALLDALAEAALSGGVFKLVAKVFTTNTNSIRLFERTGYSQVGIHVRHGRLHDEWKDVVVLEKLLGDARPDAG